MLSEAIAAAWERRRALHDAPELDAYRVLHGATEGAPGLAIDRYGDVLTVDAKQPWLDHKDEIAAAIPGDDTVVWSGIGRVRGAPVPDTVEVVEHGMRFGIEPHARGNPGLYLDARPARAWLRGNSRGGLILDLFCFTGALGVAAGVGGARAVTFVDQQKRALRRVRDNCARNGVRLDDRDLVREDVYRFLRRCERRFDGIVIASAPQVPGRPDQDYRSLAPAAAARLAPGGWLLCFFHHSDRPRADHEAEVLAAVDEPLRVIWRGGSGPDFPETDERCRLRVTAFARA